MNKIVWGAAILGTFLPTLSAWTSFFVTGVLLCVMPQAAYWAAVYSGRYGDPVWGPVATHMATLGPFLYFGFSVVKELQVSNIRSIHCLYLLRSVDIERNRYI